MDERLTTYLNAVSKGTSDPLAVEMLTEQVEMMLEHRSPVEILASLPEITSWPTGTRARAPTDRRTPSMLEDGRLALGALIAAVPLWMLTLPLGEEASWVIFVAWCGVALVLSWPARHSPAGQVAATGAVGLPSGLIALGAAFA